MGEGEVKRVEMEKKCGGCKAVLVEEAVEALGRLWHPDCFRCGKCGEVVKEKYTEMVGDGVAAGTASCLVCAGSKQCEGCKKAVTGEEEGVMGLGKAWHGACFVCALCKCVLRGSYYNLDGKPYHLNCHWETRLQDHIANIPSPTHKP